MPCLLNDHPSSRAEGAAIFLRQAGSMLQMFSPWPIVTHLGRHAVFSYLPLWINGNVLEFFSPSYALCTKATSNLLAAHFNSATFSKHGRVGLLLNHRSTSYGESSLFVERSFFHLRVWKKTDQLRAVSVFTKRNECAVVSYIVLFS
jgi:hypothetical protein